MPRGSFLAGPSDQTPTVNKPELENFKDKIMAKFTAGQIETHAKKLMESFEDGFQWSDVFTIVPAAMEIVGSVKEMTGAEKEESALGILDYIIDNTNTPWLPDSMTDPLLKKGVKMMIPMLFKASEGKFNFKGESAE